MIEVGIDIGVSKFSVRKECIMGMLIRNKVELSVLTHDITAGDI